jgi:osmotically-inducible protein OsmY
MAALAESPKGRYGLHDGSALQSSGLGGQRDLGGIGVAAITITPPASPVSVRAAIEEALRRAAEVEARQIRVEVSDRTAKLYGHALVREASAAKAKAAAAPGVASVERASRHTADNHRT